MLKYLFTTTIALITLSLSLEAGIYTESSNNQKEQGNENVFIVCDPEWACHLNCEDPGETACTWDNGFDYCPYCIEEEGLFDAANGQEMSDYAKDEIEQGNYSGTYTNNIMQSPSGDIYYRTVEWYFNPNDPSDPDNLITIEINTP